MPLMLRPECYGVQIGLQNLLLGELLFQVERRKDLLDLAVNPYLRLSRYILYHLLGNVEPPCDEE